MSRCLTCAYDAAEVFIWHRRYDEQDFVLISAEILNSLFAIIKSVIDNFDFLRILQGFCRRSETNAVLC